ncbi:protein StfP [Escherichia coli]|uniref:gp53-like domain-containing protein n=1 Tax=Escherichia coli TaxID=562 RepID=UPI00249371EE|nr:protein StfP [Escherichia coli]MDY8913319.1 protein StfP [Escherichia coli]MDY8997263.1 protein StfP [Escherichia coli]
MHRIDTKTAQKDKFGAGKNGFTRGNPQTGTPATDLDDDYFDMLQEELCSVVEASGASLEKGRHDQLLTALRELLLSRKNPFGDIKSDGTVKTALENLGLGEGAKLNAATATLGRTGFIAIPVMIGGIEQSVIIQWGWNAAKASASGGDGNTVVFPVAFNNACVAVVANYDNVSAPINAVATGGYTTTSFLLRCAAQTGSYYYNWIAIGY